MSYENSSARFAERLIEIALNPAQGESLSLYCPGTGALLAPAANGPEAASWNPDYLESVPTVLFQYVHEIDDFAFLRADVQESLEAARTEAGAENKGDFDVLVEHTPDFGNGFMVLDIEERSPGGHHSCVTIGLDLLRAKAFQGSNH